MALPKLFQRIFFHNNTTPAINEDNLNAMSKAIDDIDNRVITLGDDVITVIPQIQAYLDQAEDLVEAMELLSQNPPYIGTNGNWFVWDTNTSAFVDSGVDASISVNIADITMLAPDATPSVTNTGTVTDPIFHLFIPRGQTGNGISTIAKTGTSGLVDTYTITMTNGTTSTFTVTNGAGDMNKSVYDADNVVANAGGIKAFVNGEIEDVYAVMGQNGAVNSLGITKAELHILNTDGTWSGETYTHNSATFACEYNDDGYLKKVTVNKSTGGNSILTLKKTPKFPYLPIKLTGCPSGGESKYSFYYANWSTAEGVVYDYGDGATITSQFDYSTYPSARLAIRINSGQTVSNLVFCPMLSDPALNLSYDDYVPYAMTNRELTDSISDISTIRNNATNAYSGILKLAEYDIGDNANVTIPNMAGVWIAIMSRTSAPSCGLYLLVIHSNGTSRAIVPIVPVENTDFSISVSGTSVVVQTGTATSGRIRFLRITDSNY